MHSLRRSPGVAARLILLASLSACAGLPSFKRETETSGTFSSTGLAVTILSFDLPKGALSGLVEAEHILKRVKGIAHTRFTSADVVRHPLVARIIDAYDAAAKSR